VTELDIIKDIAEKIDGKCDELLEFRAVHTETHKALVADLDEIHQTLYAKPEGLSYKVERIALNCKSHEAVRLQKKAFVSSLLNKLATAAIIGLIIWLLALYRSHGG